MAELTVEQKKAVAMANARRRQAANQPQQSASGEVAAPSPLMPWWVNAMLPKVPQNVAQDAQTMMGNIVPDVKNIASGMYQAVTNPVDTAKGVYGLMSGLAQKAIPDQVRNDFSQAFGPSVDYQPMADAAIQDLKNRYGSVDAARQSLINSPVSTALDASTLATAGAAAGLKGINTVQKLIPETMPQNMLRNALRFQPTMPLDIQKNMTATMLREGIKPNAAGLEKAQLLKRTLGQKIDDLISSEVAPGVTLKFPKGTVLKYFDSLLEDVGGKQLHGARDAAVIKGIRQKFMEHMDEIGADYFTPRELQNFKTRLYKEIDWDKAGEEIASIDANMAAARAAREALESINPEIGPTNQRLGDLMQLDGGQKSQLSRTATKLANYRSVGMDTALKAGVGGGVGALYSGGSPAGGAIGMGLGLLSGAMAHPRTMVNSAFALDAFRKGAPSTQRALYMLKNPLMAQGLFQAADGQ